MSTDAHPNRIWFLLLCLLAVALYLPPVFFVELQGGEEAGYAAIAREMIRTGNWLQPHLQGNPVSVFPLYSWLIALFSFGSAPTLFSIRFPAVLSIWGMALLAGITARKYKGNLAGFMAAAIVLTCWASLRVGFRAQSETLHAFFMAMAWFSWYHFGPQEQHWHHAWGIALLFVFLDILTVGAKGLFLFYLPLLIARNPPKTMRQIQSAPHILMLGIFAVFTIFWIHFVGQQPFLPWNSLSFTQPNPANTGFFRHLVSFPVKVILYLLPWGLMAWAPFCQALRQFEPTGTLGGFFRALVFVPLIFFLLWPGTSALQLFPALAPMAVLLGIHFEIVVNWYRRFFLWVANLNNGLTLAGASLTALFWGLVFFGNLELRPCLLTPGTFSALALLLSLVSAFLIWLSFRLLKKAKVLPLWLNLVFATGGLRLMLLVSFLFIPFLTIGNRKLSGLALAGLAPAGALIPVPDPVSGQEPPPVHRLNTETDVKTIYLHGNYAYLVETFYLDKDIIRLNSLSAGLPAEEPVVYLLSHRQPAVPSRQWEPVSPTVNMAQSRRLTFQFPARCNQYRGIISRELVSQNHSEQSELTAEETRRHYLRLYRGVLKTE